MKQYNSETFKEALNKIDWFKVINEENVDKAWRTFSRLFLEVVDSIAPLKKVRLKQNCEPWFSGDILNLISNRDKAWVKFRKYGNEESYAVYKNLRNKTQLVIRKNKCEYLKNLISESKDSKSLWKNLGQLGLPSKQKSGSANVGLKNDNNEINFEPDFVTTKFNDFFL